MTQPEPPSPSNDSEGDGEGARHLEEIYTELRTLAAAKLARELPGQTLQATALVHEAFLRLEKSGKKMAWRDERHYFAAAAESMRRILIENARSRKSRKRGGDWHRTELDESRIAGQTTPDKILAIDEALEKLQSVDADAAMLVQLRYFGGLTIEEAASAMDTSKRSSDRIWVFARAWLFRELGSDS